MTEQDEAGHGRPGGRARFTIVSMMKDEGPALIEWVAYHRLIGFDNICVHTNDCSDGTDRMLIRLEEMGLVRHFRNEVPEGRKPQPNALDLAQQEPAITDSDWLLVMDADEFVSVKCGRGRIRDLEKALPEGTDAVAITWRFFGSNGIADWNPGLVTESYTQAAPDDFRKGWGVKTLFRPYPHMKFGIHRPTIHGAKKMPERARAMLAQRWVNGSGQPMPEDFALSGWRSTKPTLGYGLVEMNHYAVKSYEAFLLRRMRGNVNNKAEKYSANYFAIFDRNEERAPNVLRQARGVRRVMGEMLRDPALGKLYLRALDWHRARVEALRVSDDYQAALDELKRAAEVPLDRVDEVLFTHHLPRVWQQKVAEMRASGVPDRQIALMMARNQTARKGETRAALRAQAGHPPPEAAAEVPPDPAPDLAPEPAGGPPAGKS